MATSKIRPLTGKFLKRCLRLIGMASLLKIQRMTYEELSIAWPAFQGAPIYGSSLLSTPCFPEQVTIKVMALKEFRMRIDTLIECSLGFDYIV